MFALHAGIAIENARLHEQVQRLAVVDERERISHDLHDSVIQMIYAVTLSLDDVPELVSEAPDEAGNARRRAIDALHGVDPGHPALHLRPAARCCWTRAASWTASTPLRMRCGGIRRRRSKSSGDEPPDLPLAIVADLLAIAREALANVARHAGASTRHRYGCPALTESVRLEIADDGRGFDPRCRSPAGHHGLANMRTRAEGLGGDPGHRERSRRGTRIIVVDSQAVEPARRNPVSD